MSRNASMAEVRQAYLRLARERHPDRFQDQAEKARAQDFFKDLTAAYNTLGNEKNRREYDQSLARPAAAAPEVIARDAYAQGVQRFEAREFFEAIELFRMAVLHAPQDPRNHAALGRALAKNPLWVREGLQSIEKAVALSPRTAAYHLDLAEMLLGQNLKLRARKAWEAASRLAPDEPRVLKLAREWTAPDEPPPPPEPGGLRGLLRRKS